MRFERFTCTGLRVVCAHTVYILFIESQQNAFGTCAPQTERRKRLCTPHFVVCMAYINIYTYVGYYVVVLRCTPASR